MKCIVCIILGLFSLLAVNAQQMKFPFCSENDLAHLIAKKFFALGMDDSNCPVESWLEKMAQTDSINYDKVFINIGVNKGYNFAVWMNLFAKWSQITPRVWQESLLAVSPFVDDNVTTIHCGSCGCCKDCDAVFDTSKISTNSSTQLTTKIFMVGVDLNNNTINLLGSMLGYLRRNESINMAGMSFHTLNAAGSNKVGSMKMAECAAGNEQCKVSLTDSDQALSKENLRIKYNITIVDVPMITTESLVGDLVMAKKIKPRLYTSAHNPHNHNHNHNNTHHSHQSREHMYLVDILMIDTEGHDPLVLEGTFSLVEKRQIRVVMFEYHALGLWPHFNVHSIIKKFDSYGYDCYFQGQRRLWAITDACWHPAYEFRQWSNVMCVMRSDIWYKAIQSYVVSEPKY